ncbi:TnsA endonuclease N-terminal domain-containing protein [Paenirhodobacter sp.]|uniref:TnsA endonuclease N-terminal domain-containing protein n=1 Tax=Paenirhodobacter sp. TaxID=1965326 RepID=UPI003B3EE3EF
MATRCAVDEAKIACFHKEERGQGHGADYTPWLTVRDVPSRGRSHRLTGAVTGRIHHLLSDIERGALLIYDFRDDVRDIREQFPLDLDQTLGIAEAAGIRHPVDSRSRVDLVQTTDLLVDLEHDGKIVTIARTIKPSETLGPPRTIEKLEIERRYWTGRGIDWGIVTEREQHPILLRNLELLQGFVSLDDLNQPFEGYYRERAGLIAAELERWPTAALHDFCQAMDTRLGLDPGGTLLLVRHLLAARVWRVDMMQPVVETMPMRAFTPSSPSLIRRVQA